MRNHEREKERVPLLLPSKRFGMVVFSIFFFVFCSLTLLVHSSSSSSSHSLTNFDSDIDLFGDAHIVADESRVLLTRHSSSSGFLLRRTPISFTDPISLSAEFSFSISPAAGDGLLLLFVPADIAAAFPGNDSFGVSLQENYLGIEFDTSKNDNVGDLNGNHVGIDVGSLVSVAVANASNVNLVLNNGEKLNAWVDYEAGSKTLEVRLNKLGKSKPQNAIVSYPIDLFKLWGDLPVFVGVSSSNDENSSQVVSVYSWKVHVSKISKSLHSQPADPKNFEGKKNVGVDDEGKKFRPLTVLAGVIFGTGCVALVTFVVLFMWVIFFQRREDESLAKVPSQNSDVRYERIDVAVDKNNNEDDES